MSIKPYVNYREALKEVESLMTAESNTPEGKKLDVLVTLIEAYERKHFPLDLPDPVEAIKFKMEQKGLTVKMIWKLHQELCIPTESLIKQPVQAHNA